ncbi:MAG: c-type cytochrome [Xanthobacteraceae bacterium]
MEQSKMASEPRGSLDRTAAVRKFTAAALSGAVLSCFASSASAQKASTAGDPVAGRDLALRACTGCHVVSPDQPFAPVFTGPPPPPDFSGVANSTNTSAASLRKFLSTLHPVPPPQQMADPYLTSSEREDLIAFIMTLRIHR